LCRAQYSSPAHSSRRPALLALALLVTLAAIGVLLTVDPRSALFARQADPDLGSSMSESGVSQAGGPIASESVDAERNLRAHAARERVAAQGSHRDSGGAPSSAADAPPAGLGRPTTYRYPNSHCVGKESTRRIGVDDGTGFICAKALGKPKCTTYDELASLYCACCECYHQCGLSHTVWAVCKYNGTCGDAPAASLA
jgi:hypothetical protein